MVCDVVFSESSASGREETSTFAGRFLCKLCANCNCSLFSFRTQINILLQFCSPTAKVQIRRAFLLTRWVLSVERSAFRHSCCRWHESFQTSQQNSTILVWRLLYRILMVLPYLHCLHGNLCIYFILYFYLLECTYVRSVIGAIMYDMICPNLHCKQVCWHRYKCAYAEVTDKTAGK